MSDACRPPQKLDADAASSGPHASSRAQLRFRIGGATVATLRRQLALVAMCEPNDTRGVVRARLVTDRWATPLEGL